MARETPEIRREKKQKKIQRLSLIVDRRANKKAAFVYFVFGRREGVVVPSVEGWQLGEWRGQDEKGEEQVSCLRAVARMEWE